jgi:predicted DsbA family dithiol-disulfide isomerase
MPVQIEIVSDVVCPWCFIGKRRLEQALARVQAEVEVVWRPFQLNPGLPEEGMERELYVQRKFGSAGPGVYALVAAVGASVGIPFAFERIVRQPNTVAAHQLIGLASRGARQDAMVETLFRGYFLEGADLTRRADLVSLAGQAGLDPAAAQACLEDRASRRTVEDADRQARALGVEGVPFFIFDRRLAVSGAQEPQVLVQAIERAAEHSTDPA